MDPRVNVVVLPEVRMMMHTVCPSPSARGSAATQNSDGGPQRLSRRSAHRICGVCTGDGDRNDRDRRDQASVSHVVDQNKACAAANNHAAQCRIRLREQRTRKIRSIIVIMITLLFLEVVALIRKVVKLHRSFLILVDDISAR